MVDPVIRDIEWLTRGVRAIRIARESRRRDLARLIEIKGLGADVASVKKGIGDLRTAAAELNSESTGLKAEMADLTDQIKQHRADLKFEAEQLGNGGEISGEKSDSTTTQQAGS